MSWNGLGTFIINSAGQPVVSGTTISSTVFNALTADLATGLSNCITKDGQQTVTANIPFGGFKATGLGVASVTGDALSYGNNAQVANLTVTGTGGNVSSNSYTPTPTNIANTSGLSASAANYLRVGSVVTVSGLIVMTITTGGGTPTEVDFDPPIASTFSSVADAVGVCAASGATQAGSISAETTGSHRIRMNFLAQSTGAQSMYYHYTYVIK